MKNKLHVGLDIGSTTIKIMILNEDLKPVYSSYTRHFSDTKKTLSEVKKTNTKSFTEQYFSMLSENKDADFGENEEPFDFDGKNITMEHKLKEVLDRFENLVDEDSLKREEIISEVADDLETLSASTEDSQEELE